MAFLQITCPHCQTPKSPLKAVAFESRSSEKGANGLFVCPLCENPVCALVEKSGEKSGGARVRASHELTGWPHEIQQAGWTAIQVWPVPKDSSAPSDTPKNVARNFVQAEEAAAKSHNETAGMAYRRSLELALKDIAPALSGMLKKRIDALSKAGTLTPDIAEWAHSVRELGNEATHDEEVPTDEDIADLAAITRVILEYLYTMPAKVARRTNPPAVTSDETPSTA